MVSPSPLRIAILGFGGRAEGFARYAMEHPEQIKVVAIADPNEPRQVRAREMFGQDIAIFPRGKQFYDSNMAVDGVWVVSQERTHAELAVPALERGLPLLSEKPLATTVRDAYRICVAYERNPVPFVIPHSLRYLPNYRKTREIVESGVLGQIMHVHAVENIDHHHTVGYYRRGPGMFRSNTTFLLAKSSHDIDIVNWMMKGSLAKSVACFGGADYFKPRAGVPDRCTDECPELSTCAFAPPKDSTQLVQVDKDTLAKVDSLKCAWNSGAEQVDHQTLILQYDNGATADFTLKCFGENYRPLQITGSKGQVFTEPYQNVVKLFLYHPEHHQSWGPDDLKSDFAGSHGGGDDALINDWVQAVHTGRRPHSATVDESAEAVLVCMAADQAMLEHRIVELDDLRRIRDEVRRETSRHVVA